MNPKLLFLLILFSPFHSFTQTFDCEVYKQQFYELLQTDSLYLYSGHLNRTLENGTKKAISSSIINTDAFCNGIQQALNTEQLYIRSVGDPNHVGECKRYSFERFGVSLSMTGDIITDEGVYDQNNGFNTIMIQRIIDRLGSDVFKQLGKIDNSWIEMNDSISSIILQSFETKIISDSTIQLKVKKEVLKNTVLQHLQGVIFTDPLAGKHFTYKELLAGVLFKTRNKKTSIISLDFKNYTNSNFCKCSYMRIWAIKIKSNS